MKLSAARLCLDCDEIHDSHRACPSCGSTAQPLMLGRTLAPRENAQAMPEPELLWLLRWCDEEARKGML